MARRNKTDNEKYFSPFASNIRKLMEERSITQDELAKKVGKTRQTVSQYVNGVSEPGYDTLIKIARFFDVTVDYLLGLTSVIEDNYDIRKVNEYTGLSSHAIGYLHSEKLSNEIIAGADILSLVLENSRFPLILGAIGKVISEKMDSCNSQDTHSFSDAEIITATINIAMAHLVDDVAEEYASKFPISPRKRKEHYWVSHGSLEKAKCVPSPSEIMQRIKSYSEKAKEE